MVLFAAVGYHWGAVLSMASFLLSSLSHLVVAVDAAERFSSDISVLAAFLFGIPTKLS
jgi:hypothetical protein